MASAAAGPTLPPPHFVNPTGTTVDKIDENLDAQTLIGNHLYIPTQTFGLTDTGQPGAAGYSVGIVNNIAIRVTAVERLITLLVGTDANDLNGDSLMKNVFIGPLVQRVLALESRSDHQAATLADTLGQTQSTVETEMTKVKSVITEEFKKTEKLNLEMHAYAKAQETLLTKLKSEWVDASASMRAEYNTLIQDDKVKLAEYQKSVSTDGQALATSVKAVVTDGQILSDDVSNIKAKISTIETAMVQLNSGQNSQQRDIANLHVAATHGNSSGGSGSSSSKSGRSKILESRMLASINQLGSDRTKFRTWAKDIKRIMSMYFEDIEFFFEQIETVNRDPEFNRKAKMQGFHYSWSQSEFDDVVLHTPQVKTTAWGIDPYNEAVKALWALLELKTYGESNDIVEHLSNALEPTHKRNGFEAYRRIHKWYTELTGEALEMRRNQFFNPPHARKRRRRRQGDTKVGV